MNADKQDNQIELRLWNEGDFPLMEGILGDPAMTEYLGGPETPEQLRKRHERYCRLNETDDGRVFVIQYGPDKVSAGSVGFWETEWLDQIVWEMGWSVLPGFQGKGIATRGIVEAVELARATNKHRFAHAFPDVDNAPSNAVCRKAGFTLRAEVQGEYPKGHFIRSNDWYIDLFEGMSDD